MKPIKRGDIYEVDLGTGKGSEQGDKRPCLVMSNDKGNRYAPTVIVLPITSHKKKFDVTHVTIDCLHRTSFILCEQVRTVDKSRLMDYICTLDDDSMDEVVEKVKLTMAL